ncbi:sulfatase [Prosthecobacter sp. SYSU 5D2]|uniref:sulfatase family protein n=1 Tax=Prosthecobacter sp. SYSU 5D2 TaxID=3134134 RepID=UPI0031FE59A6
MNRLLPIFLALLPFAMSPAQSAGPNLLLIIADDCTYRDLGVYGGQAKTPHLNKLAAEGMKMTRCFQAAPMCSPTRHCLYTGLYPVKSGAYPNHTFAHEWVKSIAHYLQAGGYTTHLSGKTHINPPSVFPFEFSKRKGDNNPDPAVFEEVLKASAESRKPFLFIAASNEPHGPYTKGDPSAYPPATLALPPIWVDTPETRADYSKYLAEITYFDSQVGELVDLLDQNGQRENTLVIVLSEQGNSFPFAKWTCYDAGLQSGCIARWPGQVKAGAESAALVEYVDIVPTFLEAAGIARPEILEGRSFLPVLRGQADRHKEAVFGLQTTRGINAGSEFYGVRSVRNDRYRYIRNFTPEAIFECAATKDAPFASWQRLAKDGDVAAQTLVTAYQQRPGEELYDCEADPWNRTNLIADENLASVRQDLRTQLDAWMKQQGDQGQATEMAALERMPRSQKEPKKGKKKKNKAVQ